MAITPYNPTPQTPKGIEIVDKIRRSSPGLLRVDTSVVAPLVVASGCMVAGDIAPITEVVGDDLLGSAVARRGGCVASTEVSMAGRSAPASPRRVLVDVVVPTVDMVEAGAGDGAGSLSGLATIAAVQPEVTEVGQGEVAPQPVLPSVTAGQVSSPTSMTRHTPSSSTLGAVAVDASSPSTPNRATMTDSVRRSARFGVNGEIASTASAPKVDEEEV